MHRWGCDSAPSGHTGSCAALQQGWAPCPYCCGHLHTQGAGQQQQSRQEPPPRQEPPRTPPQREPTEVERAYALFSLVPGAALDIAEAAYRAVMRKVHPDVGARTRKPARRRGRGAHISPRVSFGQGRCSAGRPFRPSQAAVLIINRRLRHARLLSGWAVLGCPVVPLLPAHPRRAKGASPIAGAWARLSAAVWSRHTT
jgi:hypothetical protein